MFAVSLRPPTPTRPRARPTDAQTPQRRSKNVNELASFRFYGIVKRISAEPVRNRARRSNALKSPASDPRRSTGSPRINNVKPDPLKGLHIPSRYRRPPTMCDRRYLAVGMAETTLVSRMIIRRQLSRIGAVGAGVFAGESQDQPRRGKRIWPEPSSPGFPGPAADGRVPFSKYPWPPLPSNDHSQLPEYAAAASALLQDCAQLCLPSQMPPPEVTSL